MARSRPLWRELRHSREGSVTSGLLLIGSLLTAAAGAVLRPRLTRELLGDLRFARILHYVALAVLGGALLLRQTGSSGRIAEPALQLQFALFAVALAYAAIFAIVTNNLEDLSADRISNPDRPLVRKAVTPTAYLGAGIACLLVSLILAWLADRQMFVGIVAVTAGYYVYSCRPFRWKRVPIFAKLLIGANGLAVAVCGFALAGGDWRAFPPVWALYLLVPMSLAANFVDLKDTDGDRHAGVATLPVLLGERSARHVIAVATVAAYGMAGWLLAIPWVYPLNALTAATHLYFLYRKPYEERWVFMIYVTALFSLDALLLL